MADKIGVAALSRTGKYIVLLDGRIAPFTELFDEEGDEVADINVAISGVAQHPDGLWLAIRFDEWDSITLH